MLPALTNAVLGVEIASPGASRVEVTPPRTTTGANRTKVTSARGRLATERGPVGVSWRRTDPRHFALELTVPDNVTAVVRLPATTARRARGRARARIREGSPAGSGRIGNRSRRDRFRPLLLRRGSRADHAKSRRVDVGGRTRGLPDDRGGRVLRGGTPAVVGLTRQRMSASLASRSVPSAGAPRRDPRPPPRRRFARR